MAMTARDLFALKFVGDPRVSPDGARVAFVVTTVDEERDDYRSRIWLAPADGSAAPRPLTAGDRQDTAPRWSPDGRRLVFVSSRAPRVRPAGLDEGEEAKPQLWLLDLAGGEARQLTALREGAGDPAWSPDGRAVVFTSRTGGEDDAEPEGGKRPKTKEERARAKANRVRVIGTLKYKFDGQGFFDGKRRHLFVVDVDGAGGADLPEPRQLTDGDCHDGAPAWSPDGGTIAFTSYREPDEDVTFRSDIYVIPAAGGAPRKLSSSRGSSAAPAWSPDGRTIAYLGHVEGEGAAATTRLWTVAADGGAPVCLTTDFDRDLGNSTLTDQTLPAAAAGPAWTPDGAALLALVSDGGTCGLRRFPVAGGPPETLIGGARVVTAFSLSVDGARLVFAATDPTAPAEIFAANGDGRGERPLTALNRDLLAARDVARPERLRFTGYGGDTIDGWLLRPPGADAAGAPVPLIVELHGGPHAQYGAAFFHEFQVFAGRGYAVFYCNPHGSTGYGERFAKELLRAWGEKAMPDVMAGVDAALARGGLDGDRMGVTGGSYGGYLTNWIVTQTDRFKAAVTQRSYCNSLAVFGVDDIGAISDVAELGGHPWEIPDLYLRLSPIMHVAKVKTPVLIEHQELDYRCPISQAEQWFAALKKLGVPTQFIRYPNESHGMSRDGQPAHRLARLDHNLAWFDRWLKNPDGEGGPHDSGDK